MLKYKLLEDVLLLKGQHRYFDYMLLIQHYDSGFDGQSVQQIQISLN